MKKIKATGKCKKSMVLATGKCKKSMVLATGKCKKSMVLAFYSFFIPDVFDTWFFIPSPLDSLFGVLITRFP
jgi:hypothetical protein